MHAHGEDINLAATSFAQHRPDFSLGKGALIDESALAAAAKGEEVEAAEERELPRHDVGVEDAARPERPHHLVDDRLRVGKMLQQAGAEHGVEAAILKWQVVRVALCQHSRSAGRIVVAS